jgi:hypothetical protein
MAGIVTPIVEAASKAIPDIAKEGFEFAAREFGRSEFKTITNMSKEWGPKLKDMLEKALPEAETNFSKQHASRLLNGLGKVSKDELSSLNDYVQKGITTGVQPGSKLHGLLQQEAPNIRSTVTELTQASMQGNGSARDILKDLQANKTNFPSYEGKHAVESLAKFYSDSSHVLTEHKMFGPNDENVARALDGIKKETGSGMDWVYAKNITEAYLGRRIKTYLIPTINPETGELVERFKPWNEEPMSSKSNVEKRTNSYMITSHLSLSPMRHIGQWFNPLIHAAKANTGQAFFSELKPFAKTVYDFVTGEPEAREFALKSSAGYYHTMKALRMEEMPKFMQDPGAYIMKYNGANYLDKQRRIFSAIAGRNFVEDALAKLKKDPTNKWIREYFHELHIDPDKALKSGLDERDKLMAAKRTSDITQYRGDASTLPTMARGGRVAIGNAKGFETGALGRALFLYKKMQFQSGKFINDFIAKPAKQGNLRPLMYFATIYPMVGEAVADASNWLKYGNLKQRPGEYMDSPEKWKKFVLERTIDNIAYSIGLPIMYDAMMALSYGDKTMALESLLGPFGQEAGQVWDVGNAAFKGNLDKFKKAGERYLVSHTPFVGPIATHEIFGQPKKKNFLEKGAITNTLNKGIGKVESAFSEIFSGQNQ